MYELLYGAKAYDEVIPEQVYKLKHNNIGRTLDVMVRKDNKFLLLDSKSSVPSAKLRILDAFSFDKAIDIISDNIIQVYHHISNRYPSEYNFFEYKGEINKENTYGSVVLLEDNFIRRSLLYERVVNKLDIELNSNEHNWIVNHVKVVSLYDIEKISLIGKSLIEEFEKQKLENRGYDFSLEGSIHKDQHIVNNSYLNFKENWLSVILEVAENMKRDNIIQ